VVVPFWVFRGIFVVENGTFGGRDASSFSSGSNVATTARITPTGHWLSQYKETIEKHLKERLGDLFDLKYELLLYDITSTYFEGECPANPLAQRGYSRDSRPDCLHVCIGLVVTDDGIPPGYEVFPGNTNDSTTIQTIVQAMESKYGRAQRVWVMDRGMVSEDNLAFVRQRGGSYIVGIPDHQGRT
jgi:transposase